MSHASLAVVILGLMLPGAPLHAQDAPQSAMSAEIPDAALSPELDRVLRDYERAWGTGDAAALASLFAEDGFVLQSNRPPVRGRAAIQAAYEGQAGGPLRLRALASAAGDTSGYIIGTYRYGNAPTDTGKFTLTLHRAPGGSWLIFSDMDNLNSPPQRQRALDTTSPTKLQHAGN